MKDSKAKDFLHFLQKYNTNMNVFVILYNKWICMTPTERGEAYDLAQKNKLLRVKKETNMDIEED